MNIVDLIAGARPNFVKIAAILKASVSRQKSPQWRFRLIHTGQHYDPAMSEIFFEQLRIPNPEVNLGVGSGTQAEQTAGVMLRYEKLILRSRPRMCVVVGDVTSTLACSIVAQKMGVPVAHVEAGIRSGDWKMPEEINRIVTDSVSSYFFTTSVAASARLLAAGTPKARVFFVGNTMIDTLLANLNRFRRPTLWREHELIKGKFFVLTLHRPSNVDSTKRLCELLEEIGTAARDNPVIFPVHPRTAKSLTKLARIPRSIRPVPAQPYLEFNYLVRHARAVITDSGGVTEETTVLGIPCITLRDNTERPETVELGTNELVGTSPSAARLAILKVLAGKWKKGRIPERWDGKSGRRICVEIDRLMRVGPKSRS